MQEISAKEAFDRLRPEHCVFVISVSCNSMPNGMIAGWFMKCSMNPPMIAVSISKESNTGRLIQESREFSIAVPSKLLEEALPVFGSDKGNKTDKFLKTGIKTEESKHIKSPLLSDAAMNFECALESIAESGDHNIFIGRVLASYAGCGKKILLNVGKKSGRGVFREF